MSTPDDMGDMAEAMVPIAQQLIGAVHDDGPAAVARVFSIVPPGHLHALCVVLAAMVDPTKKPSDLLAWVDWDGPRRDPTLFDGSPDPEDPKFWSDQECHHLWRVYRSAKQPQTPLGQIRVRRGYLEWERRRADRRRKAPPQPAPVR